MNLTLITCLSTVLAQKKIEIDEMRSECETMSNENLNKLRKQLINSHQELADDRSKWEGRVEKLEQDLMNASDKLYMAKRTNRDAMQKHLDQAKGDTPCSAPCNTSSCLFHLSTSVNTVSQRERWNYSTTLTA